VDAGPWFVIDQPPARLEVYQASQSFRIEFDTGNAEGQHDQPGNAIDEAQAIRIANQFLTDLIGDVQVPPQRQSVTSLDVMTSAGPGGEPERRVAALQVNFRYAIDGLPLLGPGAKTQISVGPDARVRQAYRFWRDIKVESTLPGIPPDRAFARFAGAPHVAGLDESVTLTVSSAQVGLLCLAPTEVQSVLIPVYALRGEATSGAAAPRPFLTYVAAAEIDSAYAKVNRWVSTRPPLVVA
jgi:hypothetical protein